MAEGLVQPEERLLQGHHRQGTNRSLRIYSRDDVHGQLSFQRKLIDHVRRGGRFSTPQHRGGQQPMTEPGVQVEFFRKPAPVYSWKSFNFSGQTPDARPATPQEAQEGEISDSSSSDSSSDTSSSSEAMVQGAPHPGKRAKITELPDVPDELYLGHTTKVQHARIGILTCKDATFKLRVELAWTLTVRSCQGRQMHRLCSASVLPV